MQNNNDNFLQRSRGIAANDSYSSGTATILIQYLQWHCTQENTMDASNVAATALMLNQKTIKK
jgi:hypothetical protein